MKVLILLAHADDESLGAGGSIPYLLSQGHDVQLLIASDGIIKMRKVQDDNRSSLDKACAILGIKNYKTLDFPDQAFESIPQAQIVNAAMEELDELPDLIITHSSMDLNQDHRIIHQVAKIIGRPRKKPINILGCETPASANWNGKAFPAQLYVDIEAYLEQKLTAFAIYTHENRTFPDPFSLEGLEIMAKFRGMEAGVKAAEAFEVIRWNGL
ncbi:MAG: PIG-L family deacetylase [Bacteroidia bacterium]|nr:PIG-L family deacetylase [Bacteroidia bacterium]